MLNCDDLWAPTQVRNRSEILLTNGFRTTIFIPKHVLLVVLVCLQSFCGSANPCCINLFSLISFIIAVISFSDLVNQFFLVFKPLWFLVYKIIIFGISVFNVIPSNLFNISFAPLSSFALLLFSIGCWTLICYFLVS